MTQTDIYISDTDACMGYTNSLWMVFLTFSWHWNVWFLSHSDTQGRMLKLGLTLMLKRTKKMHRIPT